MPKPTEADWNAFKSTGKEEKAKVLFLYLCQGKVSMEKVVNMVYDSSDLQKTKNVSRITRCYGFEGNNGGKFGSLGATYDDVRSFVDKYPDGTDYDGGETMKEYLIDLVSKRKQGTKVTSNKNMLKKTNQPVSQNLVANDNKNLLKKTNQPVSQNLTANDYNYLSTGQNVGVSVSRTQKKAKSKSFRFRDIWGVHGFKRLSWALISLGVSAIPFFVILYGLLFKEDNGLKKRRVF